VEHSHHRAAGDADGDGLYDQQAGGLRPDEIETRQALTDS
jgi:hypothetical protein